MQKRRKAPYQEETIDEPAAGLDALGRIEMMELISSLVQYNCIIFYASIVGIDLSYYEAADLDGATHWQNIVNVMLPGIRATVITIVMLNIGRIFFSDFGLFYQVPMNSGALFQTTNVSDTYVYRGLLGQGNVGMSAAAGLYQSVVGFVLIMLANLAVRRFDRDSAFF